MDRITRANLEALVTRINREMGAPSEPYTKGEDGRFKANIGNYHISGAYGGVALHRIVNESGAIADVFSSGHVTKRDLYNRMRAFLAARDA